MQPFVKRILLFIGVTAVICGSFLGIKSFVYSQSSESSGFYDKVKKEMDKNANNDSFSLFQAMQAVTAQENLEKKSKITDPNDPRNDPRLKYYFGATEEIAPVPAVVKYGGVTLKVQANELIMSNLDTSPISRRQTTQLSFRFEYPEMIGRTPKNIDDFLVPIMNNKKRIWLDINTEPACFREDNIEVVSDDLHEIANYFSKFDKKFREFLLKNKGCSAINTFDIKYSSFGNKNYYVVHAVLPYSKDPTWQEPSIYPKLSEYYVTKDLQLEGYRTKGLREKGTDIIDERVYKYIPPNAKAGEYEFIVCGSNPDIMPKKFPKIRFDDDLYASCTHYFLLKNRVIMQINYAEKYFKENWQGIRNAVVKHFDSRITKIDDYVPQFYTKHKNTYQAVSQKQIDDLIKQNPKQTQN